MSADRWVEEHLSLLEPPRDFRPDASAALGRVWQRDRAFHSRRRRWMWIATAASIVSLSVLAIPGKCDSPSSNSCSQPLASRIWTSVFPKPVEPPVEVKSPMAMLPAPAVPDAPKVAVPTPAPRPVTIAQNSRPAHTTPPPQPAAPPSKHFKELGVPDAPIACEIYTDYECPSCAVLYQQTIPTLISQYVQTGKVKLLHRDFPLQQHPYARLAARYANAAGRLGYYDLVVNQLFRTQNLWAGNGGLDAQVAQVLAPGVMQQVRALVQNDGTLDNTVIADMSMAAQDNIRQTPTIVVVYKGKRQPIAGAVDFSLLQTYLDQLLK